MRASSAARSSSTCRAMSRCFWAICSSIRAWFRMMFSNLELKSLICWSFSAPSRFQFSIVVFNDRMVSCWAFERFSSSCLSFDKLLANTSRPAGPSSKISKRFSNCCSSTSNSWSLSSSMAAFGCGGVYCPFRRASFKSSLSLLLVFFSLDSSSFDDRKSLRPLFNLPSIVVLSLTASSRCTTARPTLSTKSAISLTRFRIPSWLPRACKPRCKSLTSEMWALRISVIMKIASWASLLSCPTSRLASSKSCCKESVWSRPFLNSRSSLCA
mmetsp:Transcript_91200/g.294792  ORF Transcript_91200/g.294792 Transcript_91200/m.294792 type:complete len:270 (+) Transcript_91200:784-1593(+)